MIYTKNFMQLFFLAFNGYSNHNADDLGFRLLPGK